MVKVKVCGIRREEDVAFVNSYLPDYIGFIFAESKRKVNCDWVRKINNEIDCRIKKVGIFVNEDITVVVGTAYNCSLDVVQIHGDEEPAYIEQLRKELDLYKTHICSDDNCKNITSKKQVEIWKAIRVKDRSSLNKMHEYKVDAFVLDTYVDGNYGGAGKTFNWELALDAKKYGSIVLAGGLSPENVIEAVKDIEPYAVDVSSGVELQGCKDESKIREFIQNARLVGNGG